MRMQLWPDSQDLHEKEIHEFSSDPNFVALIAEDDAAPVGFLESYIRPFANGCDSRPVPFLEGIWVSPVHRKKGVSKDLISAFEDWARSQGFHEVGSDVDISNQRSISAHESWGFEERERVVYFRKKI